MPVTIRECTVEDLTMLRAIGLQTFDDTFRRHNTPENFEAYLRTAFDPAKLEAELHNPESRFYFLEADEALAGYMKTNQGAAQTDGDDLDSLEIERIYVKADFQGRGLGKLLVERALREARQSGKRFIWLGVWEKNTNALGFYQRMGFRPVGTHDFYLGDDRQTDLIMRMAV